MIPSGMPDSGKSAHWTYRIVLFFLALTGFAQMPIFKRYYIADIPGLGWLDQFYVTHFMHYLAAVFLIGLVCYHMTAYILLYRKQFRITTAGYVRGFVLAGLLVTGILMMIKNFPGYGYPPALIITLDVAHIVFTVTFLAASTWALAGKQKWLVKVS
ncbi:MAG: hypothetical protein AB7S77_00870 [Desulfatirhabdiaceae bacterium]